MTRDHRGDGNPAVGLAVAVAVSIPFWTCIFLLIHLFPIY